jgi:protein-L-isoaspartate(D-aspartate) O-methyltransferase
MRALFQESITAQGLSAGSVGYYCHFCLRHNHCFRRTMTVKVTRVDKNKASKGSGMLDMARARGRMVERQIVRRGVKDQLVLRAMRQIPRECFIPEKLQEFAYADAPLRIEEGATISQPYIVALMIEGAEIRPGNRVLEIGTGSGYAAAVISLMINHVYSIERHVELADSARRRFKRLGYGSIEVRTGDGTQGWPEAAPFDAILVTAGGPSIPDNLRQQLAIGGRLVMPIGKTLHAQHLVKLTRISKTEFLQKDLGDVVFVPLIGKQGWSEEDVARFKGRTSVPGRPH